MLGTASAFLSGPKPEAHSGVNEVAAAADADISMVGCLEHVPDRCQAPSKVPLLHDCICIS